MDERLSYIMPVLLSCITKMQFIYKALKESAALQRENPLSKASVRHIEDRGSVRRRQMMCRVVAKLLKSSRVTKFKT